YGRTPGHYIRSERAATLDIVLSFHKYGSMESRATPTPADEAAILRYAEMFAALGTEPRLRIVRLLLAAHPDGLVVSEIQAELGIPASTLSHHLDRLKREGIVEMRRESNFLRYRANSSALGELLGFLFAECCTRSGAVAAEAVTSRAGCC